MPTQILEGPRSDPALSGATDPFTPPPRTWVAPRPVVPISVPAPQPVRTRRRGRALALLFFLAVAGAATGGTLAYYGVELPTDSKPRLPTALAALGAIRASGDYTTAPRYDSVEVTTEVAYAVEPSGMCRFLDLFCGDDDDYDYDYDYDDVDFSASGSIGATVAIASVGRGDVTMRGRTVDVYAPGAEFGEPYVDPNSITLIDGSDDGFETIDYDEVAALAADEIEGRAYDAGLRRDAHRAVRRMLVHRLHSVGFRHVTVYFS